MLVYDGYMSPEYAIDGLFSMKSNVFSFGVIILEIMSGKRNRIFRHSDHDLNLLGRTWNLWTEERAFELLDPMMEGSFPMSKVLRCIQVGLLCMQKCPEDRPMMSSVFLMLVSDSAILPQPKQPGFYIERSSIKTHDQSLLKSTPSINEVTMTCLAAQPKQPKQPGFYIERSSIKTHDQSLLKSTPSINEVTMTCLAAR
ncbi:unnamed protein product [Camellia sinensis]